MATSWPAAGSFVRCLVTSSVCLVAVLAFAGPAHAQPAGQSREPPALEVSRDDAALTARVDQLQAQLREHDGFLRSTHPSSREAWPAWAALACVGVAYAAAWWAVAVRREAAREKDAELSAARRASDLAEARAARAEFSRHVEQIIAIAQQRDPTAETNAQLDILTGLVTQLAPPRAKHASDGATS